MRCDLDLVEVVVTHHSVDREAAGGPELDEPRDELAGHAVALDDSPHDAAARHQVRDVERHLGAERRRGRVVAFGVVFLVVFFVDFVVEQMRMNAWQDTILESLLRGLERDQIIVTGAWTNMSVEHVARTGADKGYYMYVPEDCCSTMNADWHNASINYALQNVSTVTSCDEVIEAIG